MPQSCYQTPETLQSPECQRLIAEDREEQIKFQAELEKYEQEMKIYREKSAGYTRTTVFFGIVVGGILALAGLVLMTISRVVATGVLLGGLLVAILARFLVFLASVGAGVGTTQASVLAFLEFFVLLVMLGAVVAVGVWKFGKGKEEVMTAQSTTPQPPQAQPSQ